VPTVDHERQAGPRDESMPNEPLAYFITFHTYGNRAPDGTAVPVGYEPTPDSTPPQEPEDESPVVGVPPGLRDPYALDLPRRQIVCHAIVDECRFRGWTLHAVHVRTKKVLLVVTAPQVNEFVMRSIKAFASQYLDRKRYDTPDRKRWEKYGTTLNLWTEAELAEKVEYTLNGLGTPMARFPTTPT
jgi:hypothetical protein